MADTRPNKLVERPTDFSDPDALSFEFTVDGPAESRLRRLVSDKGRGLSADELLGKFKALGHNVDNPEDAAELFRLIDLSGDGQIDISELVAALSDMQAAKLSFAKMDRKGRGYVSLATVTNGLWLSKQEAVRNVARATAPTIEQLAALVEAYDDNNNGVMELPEFIAMFIDFRHGRMTAERMRGEGVRARIAHSIHAWSELEWLSDELGLGAKTKPHATSAPAWTKFAVAGLGGASGWLFVHPLDVAKTRAQLATGKGAGGLFHQLGLIYRTDGLRGFAAGLSAAMTRQLTYTTARVGLYDVFRERAQKLLPPTGQQGNRAAGFALSLACGLSAGGVAAVISCPVEVALVRMQADSLAPEGLRRNYRNVGHALYSIAMAEGISAGWRGVGATVGRGMLVSMTQLSTYDQAKQLLKQQLRLKEGVSLHLAAAICSGFAYSAISLPVDNAKTRLQHQRPGPDGKLPFTSMSQAIGHTARTEGIGALWRGFPAYFARGGGHTVCMFLCVEQYRRVFDRIYGVAERH